MRTRDIAFRISGAYQTFIIYELPCGLYAADRLHEGCRPLALYHGELALVWPEMPAWLLCTAIQALFTASDS